MMLKCFYILISIAAFKLCLCHRGAAIGNESLSGKKYLVYFVKSPYSKADDDSWLCVGALVSPTQILTAAACLVEMERIYAIAGYKKYVHGRDVDNDACTKMIKQKVVKIFVPKEYKLSADKPVEWLNVDIGVATVEKPYNFSDHMYLVHCSYGPQPIVINYVKNNAMEKTRALELGWGGRSAYPGESPPQYIKSQSLREATTVIVEKKNCARLATSTELRKLIDVYLLCASGNFPDKDGADTKLDAKLEVCPNGTPYDTANNSCVNDEFDIRRKSTNLNNGTDEQDDRDNDTVKSKGNKNNLRSSSYEFCQNDHGGPLVSWVGSQEMVIGVALDSIPNPNYECVGPHFYVSTAETANIIKCLLEVTDTTRNFCNDHIDDKRYQVKEIHIKWPEDTNNQSSSLLNLPKRSLYQRQGNEEQPLHVRPTKDLGSMQDELGKPQQYRKPDDQVYELQMNQQRAQPYYQPQDQPQEQAQEQINRQFSGQSQGQPTREQSQQQSYDQAYEHQYKQPREEASVNSYKQPQEESYRQPQVDSYNQPQLESYNQPQMESYNQPQEKSRNQVDSYNQQQMESYNQPQAESYNQPQAESYNQPQLDPYNQPKVDSYSQSRIESQQGQMYNPPQMDAYKQTQIESYMRPQGDTFNQPQKDSYKQHQVESYNQPQRESHKSPQMDSYKQSQPKSYNQPHAESYNKPQVESYNKPQTESQMQPQVQSYNQPPAEPYKQPETQSYDHPQIESFKQPPAESYNPLDILSDNQPEEDSFKNPIMESYKPPPVEPYKQPNPESYMSPQFKPAPVEPYEQPHLRQLNQPHSQQNMQPFKKHDVQPFEQLPQQSPVQPYEGQVQNVLRERPHTPSTDPPHVEAQSFEQMYSQLHSSGVERPPPPPASAAPEQTFEELYKNLHDPTLEIPHEQEFEVRDQAQEPHFNQQFEQRFEQPFEQQFDQAFDRNPKTSNEPERIEPQPSEKQDEVKVRPQVPLDYPEYL